jgi:hypothetical protein
MKDKYMRHVQHPRTSVIRNLRLDVQQLYGVSFKVKIFDSGVGAWARNSIRMSALQIFPLNMISNLLEDQDLIPRPTYALNSTC